MGIGSNQRDIAYLKGRKRIITDLATGKDYVIEYNPDEDEPFVRGPRREVANPIIFDLSTRTGWQAMIDYDVSRDLVLNVWTESPESSESDPQVGPSPFNVSPDYAPVTGIPFGGATVVGRAEIGHLGVSRDLYFNPSPGAMYRLGAAGETVRYEPQLYPRYFFADDVTAQFRVYRVGGNIAAPLLTNNEFNSPGPRTAQLIFDASVSQQTLLTRKARSWAYASTGTAYNDTRSRPIRKFFGSIGPTTPNQAVRCPIAWNATHVELVGSAIDGNRLPIPLRLWMTPRGWPAVNLINRFYGIGPIVVPTPVAAQGGITPTGIAIPIGDNIESIFVEAVAPITPGVLESPFELDFWLGT